MILGEQAGCKWPASSGRHNLEAPIGEDADADFPKIVWTRHPAHTFMDRILRLHSLLEEEGGGVDVRLGSSSGNSAPSLVAWASLMSPRCISEEWRVIGAFIALSWPSRLVGCCHRSVWRKPRASSSGTSGCPRPPCLPDLDGAARTVATRMGPEQRITSPCWRVAPSHARKLESVSTTTTTPTRGL